MEIAWASEVSKAPTPTGTDTACLLLGCLENDSSVSDHPEEYLDTKQFLDTLWEIDRAGGDILSEQKI